LTITAHDRLTTNKEVKIPKQKALVKTFKKAKLGAKEVSQKAKLLQLGLQQDTALAVLNGQLGFKTREAKANWAKALNVGHKLLMTTTNRLKKLTSNITKLHPDYDELAT
jgi:hypothetical protein